MTAVKASQLEERRYSGEKEKKERERDNDDVSLGRGQVR